VSVKVKGKLPKELANGLVVVEERLSAPEPPEPFVAVVKFARASLTWDDEKQDWIASVSMVAIEPLLAQADIDRAEMIMLDARKLRTGDEELDIPEELEEPPLDLDTALGQALSDAVDELFDKPKRSHKKKPDPEAGE
jgi:hypothetical protein